MIGIDGSTGEGGGQVLRTSLALSAVINERLVIENVRAGRDPSGLKPQHLAAVRALGEVTDADIQGDEVGSERVVFEPDGIKGGEYTVDIGTAGATTLVAHAVLPAALNADREVIFRIRGGTHVRWSPTFEQFCCVFVPILRDSGAELSVELIRRGHYPQGGGEVVLRVSPSSLSQVKPRRGGVKAITGVSHSRGLPSHIAERQANSAHDGLDTDGDTPIEIDEVHIGEAPSKGTAVTLFAQTETGKGDSGSRLGGSALGERGKPAEEVGKEAAEALNEAVSSGADVDIHTADQLVPYTALGGGSYSVPEVTPHLRTNVSVCNGILGESIEIERNRYSVVSGT